MQKPRNMKKQELDVTDIVEEIQDSIVEDFIKDTNAGEIDIPKVEIINTPMGTTTVDITPGKKVEVIGKEGEFVISQKLNNGKVSLLGPEGLILQVEPDEIRNIK